jgi:hypothetical protein
VNSAKQSGKYYRIVVKGHLESKWSEWFDGMTIQNLPEGKTAISGSIVDQAALHGLLIKVRDMGLPLVSVRCPDDEVNK